jgi:signal transduction histidine kinase
MISHHGHLSAHTHLSGEKAGIDLELKVNGEVFVEADEAKIEQVLYNLLNNALNHSAKGGKISLALIESQEAVKVEVADTGVGIPENDIPYIWDRFYKADKSGARKRSGTGLGLAIAKCILVAHDLRYGVESREGQGAKFWFEFKKP